MLKANVDYQDHTPKLTIVNPFQVLGIEVEYNEKQFHYSYIKENRKVTYSESINQTSNSLAEKDMISNSSILSSEKHANNNKALRPINRAFWILMNSEFRTVYKNALKELIAKKYIEQNPLSLTMRVSINKETAPILFMLSIASFNYAAANYLLENNFISKEDIEKMSLSVGKRPVSVASWIDMLQEKIPFEAPLDITKKRLEALEEEKRELLKKLSNDLDFESNLSSFNSFGNSKETPNSIPSSLQSGKNNSAEPLGNNNNNSTSSNVNYSPPPAYSPLYQATASSTLLPAPSAPAATILVTPQNFQQRVTEIRDSHSQTQEVPQNTVSHTPNPPAFNPQFTQATATMTQDFTPTPSAPPLTKEESEEFFPQQSSTKIILQGLDQQNDPRARAKARVQDLVNRLINIKPKYVRIDESGDGYYIGFDSPEIAQKAAASLEKLGVAGQTDPKVKTGFGYPTKEHPVSIHLHKNLGTFKNGKNHQMVEVEDAIKGLKLLVKGAIREIDTYWAERSKQDEFSESKSFLGNTKLATFTKKLVAFTKAEKETACTHFRNRFFSGKDEVTPKDRAALNNGKLKDFAPKYNP